jgi:hypothetical protein
LLSVVPPHLHPEGLVAYGDPAEEIAKLRRDRQAGLIVIGLHASPLLGPRMGSVTYRVLCLVPALVLALPPVMQSTVPRSRFGSRAEPESEQNHEPGTRNRERVAQV